ncbi:hypothetical protein CRUP_014371 [Coryphaenoides rupestris]|nr:hypothetical protein CRUP_014371 [Coryphaenoides rupestris]
MLPPGPGECRWQPWKTETDSPPFVFLFFLFCGVRCAAGLARHGHRRPGPRRDSSANSLPIWETENKIHCKQTLVDGVGPKTHWTRELNGDELILTFGADDVVCTRIYMRE